MGTLGEQIREDTAGTLPWGHGVFVPSRQSPPASPLLEDLGLDRSNPSSPWSIHGLPPSPPVPATGTGQEWGPPGFSTPAAPEPRHGHVPSPPAHSLLSAFSTQKRAAALHGRWREDAARGQLGAAAGTPGTVAGFVPSAPGSDEVSLSLSASLPPRCVLRSARAASKREPRWAAARRGVPTPTTTRVPSTQVSPAAGIGGGGTWGPPPSAL